MGNFFKDIGDKLKDGVKSIGKVYASPYKALGKGLKKAGLGKVGDAIGAQGDFIEGKSFKNAVKKGWEGFKVVAPAMLGAAGGQAAVSADLGKAASGLAKYVPKGLTDAIGSGSEFLSKAGRYAKGIGKQLGNLHQQLEPQKVGEDVQYSKNLPNSVEVQGPPSPEEARSTSGMDPKTLALVAAAGIALLFLMRKR